MDAIAEFHQDLMEEGGNRKFLEFVELYQLKKLNNHDLFITKGIEFYRKKLYECSQAKQKL